MSKKKEQTDDLATAKARGIPIVDVDAMPQSVSEDPTCATCGHSADVHGHENGCDMKPECGCEHYTLPVEEIQRIGRLCAENVVTVKKIDRSYDVQ